MRHRALHPILKAYAEQQVLPRMQAAELIAAFSVSREFGAVAFGTEGGLFDAVGTPTVVCGPGSMDQGHKPDEFVSIEQLAGCDLLLQRLLDSIRA